MATTRQAKDPSQDEEFLAAALQRGRAARGGQGRSRPRSTSSAPIKLHPKNEKAQNLLGLTYFKLGLFDRAAEIYELLVRENPADPTLRVNLGLVYLKTNDLTARGARVRDRRPTSQPEHKKAHNYLGLALAQAGDYARAREHFVIAGSDAMAEKMAKALAAEARPAPISPRPAPAPAEAKVPGAHPGVAGDLPRPSSRPCLHQPPEPAAAPVPLPAAPLPTFGATEPPSAPAAASAPPRESPAPAAKEKPSPVTVTPLTARVELSAPAADRPARDAARPAPAEPSPALARPTELTTRGRQAPR